MSDVRAGVLPRRAFLRALACGVLTAALAGCGLTGTGQGRRPRPRGSAPSRRRSGAVLGARPGAGDASRLGPGTHRLALAGSREALLHLPQQPAAPLALVVSLHGAGGDAQGGLSLLVAAADAHGFAVLAPASAGATWDAIGGRYGEDVAALDEALTQAFDGVDVDPERVAVAGFSDGASYALGLGLANGELFRRIVAFSPGFVPPAPRSGEPAVFVSHGVQDDVLPIRATSRRIVPALRDDGYDVTSREFDGGHVVPPEVVTEAVLWAGWDRQA